MLFVNSSTNCPLWYNTTEHLKTKTQRKRKEKIKPVNTHPPYADAAPDISGLLAEDPLYTSWQTAATWRQDEITTPSTSTYTSGTVATEGLVKPTQHHLSATGSGQWGPPWSRNVFHRHEHHVSLALQSLLCDSRLPCMDQYLG